MKKIFKILSIVFIIIVVSFMVGPKASFEAVDNIPLKLEIPIEHLENIVKIQEQAFDIKPDNQARVIWADSIKKTPYSFVYLHGFSASQGEADPIMTNLIKKYKFNAYLSRLSQHGLQDPEAMLSLTPASWVKSAKEAIAIGKLIGDKVIVISTSTGSTLGTYLAANDPDISHLVMMSPNFELHDKSSRLMMMPWGKQILKFISKGNYHYWNISNPYVDKYWNTKKRIEGLIALRELIDQTMTEEVFQKINVPYFIAYYYQDKEHKDEVISIEAIQKFHNLSSTPSGKKIIKSYDAEGHVIGCQHLNSHWESVQEGIFSFLDENLN